MYESLVLVYLSCFESFQLLKTYDWNSDFGWKDGKMCHNCFVGMGRQFLTLTQSFSEGVWDALPG